MKKENWFTKYLGNYHKYFEKFIVVIVVLIVIYLINKFQLKRGGIGNSSNYIKLEIPLLVIFLLAILSILKNTIYAYLIAAIPFFLFYYIFNEFYIYFGRILKISDINELPELIAVSDNYLVIISFFFVIVYLFFVFKNIDTKKIKRPIFFLGLILIMLFSVKIYPNTYLNVYKYLEFEYDPVETKKSARENGYLNFILFEESKKNDALISLNNLFTNSQDYKETFIINKKLNNVHLIVLESFYDPNMFVNLKFSSNPISENFNSKFHKTNNFSISPAYAGGTPQAEFELLLGAPALNEFGSIEFNLFTGSKIEGYVSQLNRLGYQTIVTNALDPDIFNAYNAYSSIGFQKQYYSKGKTYLKNTNNEAFLFDGDLLNQNLNFIDSIIKSYPKKPVFNYVLGMYGHTPFSLDEKRHAQFIQGFYNKNLIEERFIRSINQIYYRTEALNEYIDKLKEIDPNSLIIIIGDHMPFIEHIKKYGYKNKNKIRFYLIENGNPVNLNKTIHHYEIPDLILKYVTGNEQLKEDDLKNKYRRIIYQAIY